MVAPPMHRLDVYRHDFFIPKRLLWANWENFITRTIDPETDALPVHPYFTLSDVNPVLKGGLADYLGLPLSILVGGVPTGNFSTNINPMAFAAYVKTYDDYFRDENLQEYSTSRLPDGTYLEDGDNTAQTNLYLLRARAWTKDYFTSALPWAQKGEQVKIPLNDARIHINDLSSTIVTGAPTTFTIPGGPTDHNNVDDPISPQELYAANSFAAGTINDLTFAQRLQEWFEKMARGGSRYIEQIKEHFGVFSSDKRLQRPEYIGGSKTPVIIGEVLNTTGTDDLPQGNMSGKATAANYGNGGSYYCEEHGIILSLLSVLPRPAYQQGIPKQFLKINDAYEHFFPSFAHLGEQPILNKEIYAYTTDGDEEFGYTPRYAEYKFENSRVAGDFRTDLDFWHLGRIFDDLPALNEAFIACNPTQTNRIWAVTDTTVNKLYAHVLNKVFASRLMPKYGTPIH